MKQWLACLLVLNTVWAKDVKRWDSRDTIKQAVFV
jgi:hypothetical protein